MQVGLRVVRGPDWRWEDADGGEGHVGTVVDIGGGQQTTVPDKCVTVVWDAGTVKNVRAGFQGAFDLLVLDNAQCGVRHPDVMCSECLQLGIEGIRWRCSECPDVNLCTPCYMADRHDLDHEFCRLDTPASEGVAVPERSESHVMRRQALGIFVGATVGRGRDWVSPLPSEVGVGDEGTVTELTHGRSVAMVTWTTGQRTAHQVGRGGKVHLKCLKDASGGFYYKNHLLVLGQSDAPSVVPPAGVPDIEMGDDLHRSLERAALMNLLLPPPGLFMPLQVQHERPTDDNQTPAKTCIGYRVVRGPDLVDDTFDGGEGHVGTVQEMEVGLFGIPVRAVRVVWDNGIMTSCRVGASGSYDLRVLDTAPAGVRHSFNCDECKTGKNILGIRWRCTECMDYDLCTQCYMGGQHDLGHAFVRIDGPSNARVLVPARALSQETKVEAKGIFLGAHVTRGVDWKWDDLNGEGEEGEVVQVRNYAAGSYRSGVKVQWKSGYDSICRVGHRGRQDLKCVTPATGGVYYRNHLHVLGKVDEPYLKPGDKTFCRADLKTLIRTQKQRFKWIEDAAKCLNKVGIVRKVLEDGDVEVEFPASGHTQNFSPEILVKVKYSEADLQTAVDSPAVQEAMKLGLSTERVRRVVEERLAFTGLAFTSVDDVTQAVAACDDVTPAASGEVKVEVTQGQHKKSSCSVCQMSEANTAFVPCGHIVCCGPCSEALTSCPVCGTPIQLHVRTYIP
ncbi:E3 ubiquitin-protein ligase mind-bomb-like [Physella acuta]|uniref:E3 ubiquitin-protein ligase mind-bomb-like n=1 Tax=Physella acuta TaxID=109671 RepID=UPI0027DDFD69|nr:E3 ubiquitin-protein ligase mind-bomb-like [Physella acuta]